MKKIVKKTVSAALAVVLLLCLLVVPAYADGEDAEAEKWNIMLVVDGSASLSSGQTTDPDGLRFEAIGSFLATLNAESADVGAIIFTSNDTDDISDEAMQRGIKLNTGVLSMEDSSARQYLLNAMMNVKRDDRNRGQTDIGTALLCAQETLSALGNGRRSAIFLFTDGLTEVDGADVYNKSMENMQTAINHIREENMLLCGVYLNKDGKQASGEVRNIVMNANNISDSSLSLGDLYVEITDAQSCMDSTDRFLRALGYGITGGGHDVICESVDRTIRIPGVGVEEANFRLRTLDGQPLPKGMDVIFTQPDGTVISGAAASAICSTGSSYRVYKFTNPMSGTWKIHIELPEGNKVNIEYNPIFSVNVGAVMDTSPSASDLHSNMDVEVTGQMTQGGNVLTAREAYQEYSCILHLTNIYTAETTDYEITQDGNGKFTRTIHLDSYDTYDAMLEFVCDKISVRAPSATWILENRAPTVNSAWTEKVPYGLLQKREKEVDLGARASDLEDGLNVRFVLTGGTCDMAGVSVQGDKLYLQGGVCGTGSVIIDVIDSQGAASQMQVNVAEKNMTVPVILLLVGGLLLAALSVLLVIRHINGIVPGGYCTLNFEAKDGDGGTIPVELKPEAPGTGRVGRKTNLYEIVKAELNQTTVQGVSPKELETVKSFVERDAAKDLKAVAVKCVRKRADVGNANGKKVPVVMLAVRWNKNTDTLYNNSIRINASSAIYDFGYYDTYDGDGQDDGYDDGFDDFDNSYDNGYDNSYDNGYDDESDN